MYILRERLSPDRRSSKKYVLPFSTIFHFLFPLIYKALAGRCTMQGRHQSVGRSTAKHAKQARNEVYNASNS